jgi:hypothetical protein
MRTFAVTETSNDVIIEQNKEEGRTKLCFLTPIKNGIFEGENLWQYFTFKWIIAV